MDDKAREEKASNNRGTDFHSRGELEKAIECHEKDLEIAIEIGDRVREGKVYGNLGHALVTAYWVTSEEPLSIIQRT